MAVKFRCPRCGRRMRVNVTAGVTVSCPHCDSAVVVPLQPPEPGDEASGRGAIPLEAAEAEAGAGREAAARRAVGAGEEGAGEIILPLQIAKAGEQGAGELAAPLYVSGPEEEELTGVAAAMSYLLLYVASWGASVIFHAILILLCIFMVWKLQEVREPGHYDSEFIEDLRLRTEERQFIKGPRRQADTLVPRPARFAVEEGEAPMPKGDIMEPVGVAGTGRGRAGLPDGTGTRFMGIRATGGGSGGPARKIVYVIDCSGSMTDTFDYVKMELKRSIGELKEDPQFHVIFFAAGKPLEMPAQKLASATEHHKKEAYKFINGIVASNPYLVDVTDPTDALKQAFALNPKLIYFLTDGEFDRVIIDMIRRWNPGRKVVINTISFIYRSGEEVLKQIAEQNQGTYRFVSEGDLATLVQ